ncbi:MAG TPA: hypothetical protein VHY48_04900 [Acidobacteriaceae bacterium]|jgi:hypothetical protein|nr:hypothetical protein [Acidobacteriaceae bacterium]
MLLFDEDAGADACEALPGGGEPASDECTMMNGDAAASAVRERRLKEMPTSLPVGGIITPV